MNSINNILFSKKNILLLIILCVFSFKSNASFPLLDTLPSTKENTKESIDAYHIRLQSLGFESCHCERCSNTNSVILNDIDEDKSKWYQKGFVQAIFLIFSLLLIVAVYFLYILYKLVDANSGGTALG